MKDINKEESRFVTAFFFSLVYTYLIKKITTNKCRDKYIPIPMDNYS